MSGNTNGDIWLAGAFAAFTVDLLVYPLDTLKTRIQSPDYKRLYLNEASTTIRKAALFRGLYQGVGSVIIATLPSSGAFFTTYEFTKAFFTRHNPHNGNGAGLVPIPILHAAASGLSELVSCAILTPAEVIKQNAQMVSSASITKTAQSATRQTLQKFRENPFALWRGYGVLAGRNLPFTALQFPMFERLKSGLQSWRNQRLAATGMSTKNRKVPLYESGGITALAAGTAGAIAAVVTTPIDVVKTRIMLAAATTFAKQDISSKATDALKEGKLVDALGAIRGGQKENPAKKMNSWAIGKEIVKDHGWKGLWRGGALRAAWTMLGSGLYLGVYESGRVYLESRRKSRTEDE